MSDFISKRLAQEKHQNSILRKRVEDLSNELTAAKVGIERLQAARESEGGEAVAYMFSDEYGRTKIVLGKETAEHWCPPDETVDPLYTHPAPSVPDPDMQTIEQRDYWEGKATELAEAVGQHFGFDVGDHSSANCPVQTAIDEMGEIEAARAQGGECDCCGYPGHDLAKYRKLLRDAACEQANKVVAERDALIAELVEALDFTRVNEQVIKGTLKKHRAWKEQSDG